MSLSYDVQKALYEHRFWLQILGDHARFIANVLAPSETQSIAKAQSFMQSFDKLYLSILNHLIAGNPPPLLHPLHHHLLWLLDAAGHAGSIEMALDLTEKRLISKSESFLKQFEHFYLKATEMAGYLRTGVNNFPALGRLNHQAATEITKFSCFLAEIKDLIIKKEVLSTLSPLLPDHMLREECYYLTKLAQVSEVQKPDCDATRPRDT